ncbi:MAG: peptide deformylase [Candidatus Eremiobacteraeota bacterium]|nr:peptide deformylase [Candidatus Eremiobacteraeota bacterium]
MPYVRPILTDGEPVLRKTAKKVSAKELRDPLFQQLIDDMFETMYDAPGVGLAAPQIGISKRIFVMDVGEDEEHPEGGRYAVINPKIELAEEEVEMTEGCLSVPGFVGELPRYRRVRVSGLDRNGERVVLEGVELFAQALQHEIDHLNGVLYSDKAINVRVPKKKEEAESGEAAVPQEAAEAH